VLLSDEAGSLCEREILRQMGRDLTRSSSMARWPGTGSECKFILFKFKSKGVKRFTYRYCVKVLVHQASKHEMPATLSSLDAQNLMGRQHCRSPENATGKQALLRQTAPGAPLDHFFATRPSSTRRRYPWGGETKVGQ